jgi:hypothetical protein
MIRTTLLSITFFLLLNLISNVNAQQIYATSNGRIRITTKLDGAPLIAVSNNLAVLLNYETAQFELRLDKSTIKTGVDSLDKRLSYLQGDLLIYKGKLGVEYIQTQSHPPQDFVIEGYLNCASCYGNIIGEGHLEHVFSGVYSCILNMTFHLNLKAMNLDIGLNGLSNEVHVEIIQTVLENGYE